ncbi:MAG: hypothetical protein WB622_14645 [Acidobacteriaceae bacterium]
MRLRSSVSSCARLHRGAMCLAAFALCGVPAFGSVTITSPAPSSTSISAVTITASSSESGSYHLEIWDNGTKLGNVFASSVNGVYVLPNGSHSLTVNAVSSSGTVLDGATVAFNVQENCTTSGTVQCNIDQQPINNAQNLNDPPGSVDWTANPDGQGIQGSGGHPPSATNIQAISETGTLPDQNNTTLNGQSLELSETQASGGYSNVLFSADSPNNTPTLDTHWTLDEYVMLPILPANQAFETDMQYVIDGVWTKFYTECAFNQAGKNSDGSAGTGYWAVFDSETGGWIFLDGEEQNGVTPPSAPCNYGMFGPVWAGSSNPGFNGWHHVVWQFVRNSDGTITFVSVTVDNTVTNLDNFNPPSNPGGTGSNNGTFSALVQLDGINNSSTYPTVTAYINELNITHTP